MKDSHKQLELPSWFNHISPSTGISKQLSLFTESLYELLARLQISLDELARWHDKGWVSFDASKLLRLAIINDPKSWELYFVRDIVRSGLTDAQIT